MSNELDRLLAELRMKQTEGATYSVLKVEGFGKNKVITPLAAGLSYTDARTTEQALNAAQKDRSFGRPVYVLQRERTSSLLSPVSG